jgi:hypothetical protein
MRFSAPDLFAAYEIAEPTNEEDLYQHIRFVAAFRGSGHADHLAGI